MNIVVAEDAEETATLIKFALEKAGYTVRVAPDGVEALRLIDEQLPDLLITDIVMPGLNGFEVMSELKRKNIILKIIVLAVQKSDEDIIRGLGHGAVDFVQKPFNPKELLARVKLALSR